MSVLTIGVDASPALTEVFRSLSSLAERGELRVEQLDLLKEIAGDGDLLVAACAGEGRVVFEPSDRLARLVAAARAGNFDGVAIQKSHRRTPVSGCGAKPVADAGGAVMASPAEGES